MAEEWQEERWSRKTVSMTDVYRAAQLIVTGLVYAPRNHRQSSLDSILEDFKPDDKGMKRWLWECHEEEIKAYVNNDLVFLLLTGELPKNYSREAQEGRAYQEAVLYAMMQGLWKPEYQTMLSQDEEKDDLTDCA